MKKVMFYLISQSRNQMYMQDCNFMEISIHAPLILEL